MYEDEPPRSHWSEILSLAERLSTTPRLIPLDQAERIKMFGLAHEICGEDGLGWNRRLLMFDGLDASARRRVGGVNAKPVAGVKRMRFRYSGNVDAIGATHRIAAILKFMAALLLSQQSKDSHYFHWKRADSRGYLLDGVFKSVRAYAASAMPDAELLS